MPKFVKTIINNIKKEKLMSTSNILIMTVTFLLLGSFLFVVAWSQTALRYLEQQVQVSVFFKDDFTEPNILALKSKLESDKRVAQVIYISKDQAFKIFSEINKDEPELLQSITPSVLPASIEVKTVYIKDLDTIASELSTVDGVEEVRFFRDVVQKFKIWSNIIYIVGSILVLIFFIVSYSIIISTLRHTINSRGMEVEIMKLVGATDTYVKKPLIFQAIVFGVTAGVISGIIFVILGIIMSQIKLFSSGLSFGFLPNLFISPFWFSVVLFFFLVLSGIVLGWLGSTAAIKKYLKY